MESVTLFRPVGPKELELIKASGFRAFPPRLPDQPIFYPVTNHAYATQIARDYSAVHASPLAELAADLKVVCPCCAWSMGCEGECGGVCNPVCGEGGVFIAL
jgi:hypothetical protein